jgi:hypothetical protein
MDSGQLTVENVFLRSRAVEKTSSGSAGAARGGSTHEWSEEIPTAITMFNDTGEYCFPYVSASLILIIFVE